MSELPDFPEAPSEEKMPTEIPPLPPAAPANQPWYQRGEFWLGFFLFYAFAIGSYFFYTAAIVLLAIVFSEEFGAAGSDFLIWIIGLLPWLVLLGLTIFAFFRRRMIAVGIVAGFASAILAGLCLGAFITVVCFQGNL